MRSSVVGSVVSSVVGSVVGSVVLSCALGLAFAGVAHAGPVEQLVQLVLHPSDPDRIVLRYEFGYEGLFLSDDGGERFRLVCNTFIDPSTNARRGTAAMAGDGTLFLGVFDGAYKDDGQGCAWTIDEGIGPRWVSDLTGDPEDPEVLYAVTSNGDPGVMNGIAKRDAAGEWTELGTRAELLISRLRVASTGSGLRFYEAAVLHKDAVAGAPVNYVIRVSDDAGDSWQEFPFADPLDGQFEFHAVDPSNPDRLVAVIDRDAMSSKTDTVLVSLDGGQTFEDYAELTDLGGVAFGPDGRVFLGDRGSLVPDSNRGLWTAPSLEDAPVQLTSDYAVGCLGYQAATDTLFGCELRAFGVIDQATGALDTRMRFDDVEALNTCEGVDVVAACQTQLCRDYCLVGHFPETPLCEVYQSENCGPCSLSLSAPGCTLGTPDAGGVAGSTPPPDAGATAGSSAGDAGPAMRRRDDGCSLSRVPARDAGSSGLMPFAVMLGLGVALARMRRRK